MKGSGFHQYNSQAQEEYEMNRGVRNTPTDSTRATPLGHIDKNINSLRDIVKEKVANSS